MAVVMAARSSIVYVVTASHARVHRAIVSHVRGRNTRDHIVNDYAVCTVLVCSVTNTYVLLISE